MKCYIKGDLIEVPQNVMLFNEESMHKSMLFPKVVTSRPHIGCVVSTENGGDVLKVFIKEQYFLVKAKDVHFPKEMANAC